MHSLSFCTTFAFLGGRISMTVLTLEGFGLMLSRLTTLSRSILEGTRKTHFLGLIFHLYLLSALKV